MPTIESAPELIVTVDHGESTQNGVYSAHRFAFTEEVDPTPSYVESDVVASVYIYEDPTVEPHSQLFWPTKHGAKRDSTHIGYVADAINEKGIALGMNHSKLPFILLGDYTPEERAIVLEQYGLAQKVEAGRNYASSHGKVEVAAISELAIRGCGLVRLDIEEKDGDQTSLVWQRDFFGKPWSFYFLNRTAEAVVNDEWTAALLTSTGTDTVKAGLDTKLESIQSGIDNIFASIEQ